MDKPSRGSGSRYLSFSKKPSHNVIEGDGTITVSRSVDVYRSQRPSMDTGNAYGVEMGKWKSQHTSSGSYASDERVIMDDDHELKSKDSHKSAQCSVREFFLGEATKSKDHV